MRSVELIIIKQNNNECFKFEEKKSKKTERDERRYIKVVRKWKSF